jgi:capsular polysaccharide export protein
MCFYESNVRYYHFSEEYFKREQIELVYLCLYPSAKSYCKKNNLQFIYLPTAVRKVKPDLTELSDEFYKFHIKLLPNLETQYIEITKKYFQFYKELFNKSDVKGVIVIGDVRLFSSTARYWALKYNKSISFFEPGPFDTMIFDRVGVNKNMEISSFSIDYIDDLEEDEDVLAALFKTVSSKKYYDGNLMAYFSKIPDVFLSVPPWGVRGKCPVELQTGESFISSLPYLFNRILNMKKQIKQLPISDHFIFFPLQVPCDVQIVMNSPFFSSIFEMVEKVIKAIPDNYKLVIREHPMNIGRYGESLYDLISNTNNVELDNNNNIWKLVSESDLVIVNNSTVGVESLKFNTDVLVLGECYYSQVVHNYKHGTPLKDQIKQAIKNKIPRDRKNKYLMFLAQNYLVKDNYKNVNYDNLIKMVDKHK